MILKQFIPEAYTQSPEKGYVSWRSPSNIALVKYWGKHGEQLPKNTSISFTLSNCATETILKFQRKEGADFDFQVLLDGKREANFEPKIEQFFSRIEAYLPFLRNYSFTIETSNSFPHSSGIASSASGMSALACCLMQMERMMVASDISEGLFNQRASFLARLGSGSASRSIEGPLVVWGEHSDIEGSSNLFGVKFDDEVHENFSNYQDTILLVDKGEKVVSSTAGHDLMHNHPYAAQRFEEANRNISRIKEILKTGDLKEFIEIVESEALQLHAMMMTSMPYFILMKPNTLEIINKIWKFRKETNSNACFTLDAGANVHLLYPEIEKTTVHQFISEELAQYCKNGEYIHDFTGNGASELKV
ncbi:MAG: diphosphomevalonate decarboxylase [Flavobacteriaceae bacterium]|nr:diphosphomevalonate decarboxylase [Flavobacteriaceae bacterium]